MDNDLDNNKNQNKNTNLWTYTRNNYRWFLDTPTRALNKAYQAALKLQSLEKNYSTQLESNKQNRDKNYTIGSYLQADIDKYLAIVKINMAEFKVSRLLLNKSDRDSWQKLVFIDEIINKYRLDLTEVRLVSEELDLSKTSPSKTSNNQDDFAKVKPITEKTGILPRSLGRTVDKIKTDLNQNSEEQIIENFRRQRRTTQKAVQCILLLIFIPLLTQKLSKEFLLLPSIEQYRQQHHGAIFINLEMKEEAFKKLEELKFNNLISISPPISPEIIEEKVKEKAQELVTEFRKKGNSAIANVFADLLGLCAFTIVAFTNKKSMVAIKTFLDRIMYDLSDSAKAFLLILFTGIFVGFHSPHGWEVLLEGVANHLGIQPNHSAIFLFIATFPVILDTIFKYWIFRYLNRVSPSAVATFKNMNE
jgi:hypothetical protein